MLSERIRLLRFSLGRTLIHAGLKAMPHGRARREIHRVLEQWGEGVRTELRRVGYDTGHDNNGRYEDVA